MYSTLWHRNLTLIATIAATICSPSTCWPQQIAADEPPKPPTVRRLVFSPDGKSLAIIHSVENTLVVWDVAARKRRFVVREKSGISSVAYSPGGDELAIATASMAKLLDPASGQFAASSKDTSRPSAASFSCPTVSNW